LQQICIDILSKSNMSTQVQFSVIENLFTEFGQVIGCECDSDDITEIANAFIVYLSNTGLKISYQYQHQHQYQLQEQRILWLEYV